VSTFDLPIHYLGERGEMVVKAEIVDVAPHLAHVASFAVHRAKWLEHDRQKWWKVTNVETGFGLGASLNPSKALAIDTARALLAQRTVEQIEAAMNAAYAKTPAAPSSARLPQSED
jgi:hypothetical protein